MDDEKDIGTPEDLAVDAAPSSESGQPDVAGSNPDQPAEATMVAEAESDSSVEGETPVDESSDDAIANPGDASEEEAEAEMMAMLEELPDEQQTTAPEDINFGNAAVSGAEFQQLQAPTGAAESRNIELLLDVNLPVAIELGRTKMPIGDILGLGPGSVVELNKLAGEPVDLLVNGRIVAKGEVVVIDENFGVRITQLLTTEERLKVLGEQ